jgi:Transglutaminase-like enzymes, putative cysteine proteases
LLVLTFVATARAQPNAKPGKTVPVVDSELLGEAKTQKWEFGVSIRAASGASNSLFGTFPIPSDWPEQQVKTLSEDITSHVQRHSIRTIEGLKQVLFEVQQVLPGDTAKCFITLEVTKHRQVPPTDKTGFTIPKDPPRDIRKYLLPSPLVESTNPKVRTLARELTAEKESAWEQVQAIVAGVRERVRFEVDPKNLFKGAAGALRDGKADKEDLTATFVAVSRAAKIPARMVWAMDYGYAEFYLTDANGKGTWYPCVVHQDVELGACKDVRPILEKGDNFKVPEEKAPQRFVEEFLKGKDTGGGRPAVEFRRHNLD